MASTSTPVQPDETPSIKLVDSHREVLVATDAAFGAACILSLLLAIGSWLLGHSTWVPAAAIFGFLVCNVILSQISLNIKNPYVVEVMRAVSGLMIVPGSYLLVDGPLAPWWLGAMIMSLGGAIVLGLLTRKPFWGRVLSVYYISLLALAVELSTGNHNWYAYGVQATGLTMVGFLFSKIMSLLGQAMAKEQERSQELARVRDALFAEMEVAQEIQMLLLPKEPRLDGLEIAACMRTASEVGGDYYDVLEMDGRAFLAIGDVSGHGVTSGLTMMMARTSLVAALEANSEVSLPELYCTLNRCIAQSLSRMDIQLYMTFALLEHMGEGRFRGVGRHLPFLVHRARTGVVEETELDGVWLGIYDGLQPEQVSVHEIQLGPGDTLLAYTDGVVEHAADEGSEMFGLPRLGSILSERAEAEPRVILDSVLDALYEVSDTPEDDVTMMVVRREASLARVSPLPGANQNEDTPEAEDEARGKVGS